MSLDRRHLLQSAGLLGLAAALPAHAAEPAMPGDTAARALLDRTTEALLADYPENAAYLGVDTGARAALKREVNDRSAEAEHRRAADCAGRLAALQAIDRRALSPAVALDIAVTQAAHQLAADGWRRMPVGDVAILNATSATAARPTPSRPAAARSSRCRTSSKTSTRWRTPPTPKPISRGSRAMP